MQTLTNLLPWLIAAMLAAYTVYVRSTISLQDKVNDAVSARLEVINKRIDSLMGWANSQGEINNAVEQLLRSAIGYRPEREESLAEYAHDAWSGWMKYLFSKSAKSNDGSVIIPASLVARWERQMNTPYHELPEEEKKSDRDEAAKMQAIFAGKSGPTPPSPPPA